MNLISYITAGNLIKIKINVFIYVLWNTYLLRSLNSLFLYVTISLTMIFSVCTFFCFHFYLFFKPKWFYQYLLSIPINVFNLINFTKLCRLLATIVNTQETFKSDLNVVLGWYEVKTSDKVQLKLKQRCVYQRWTTSNQRCLFRHWY